MPVKSIECQLTQAQMRRYLAGTDLPETVVAALQRHLQACPECMASANREREALGGGPLPTAQAVVEQSEPMSPLAWALSKLKGGDGEPHKSLLAPPGDDRGKPGLLDTLRAPKNLTLSLALAAVLVLMSVLMRSPTSVFGRKASAAIPAQSGERSPATKAPSEPKAESKGPEPQPTVPKRAPSLGAKAAHPGPGQPLPHGKPKPKPKPFKPKNSPGGKRIVVGGRAIHQLPKLGGEMVGAEPSRSASRLRYPTPRRPRVTATRRRKAKAHSSFVRVYKP